MIRPGDIAEYWKYGLWLKDGQRDTQLLVQVVDTSTDDAPGEVKIGEPSA